MSNPNTSRPDPNLGFIEESGAMVHHPDPEIEAALRAVVEVTTMTESEFDTKYEPIGLERDGSGTLWREEHEIPEDLERNHLWTVVEGDEGTCYIPDWHFVNRVAYVVTKVPWEHVNIEVKVDGPDDEIKVCDRHGGEWGDDETCARCTYESGEPRPVADPGPLGEGDPGRLEAGDGSALNYFVNRSI